MSKTGFSRMIVEKPFGRDTDSCRAILASLGRHFDESEVFRIDHYLGKEMVQNLMVMRFGNIWMENMWNRNCVQVGAGLWTSELLSIRQLLNVETRNFHSASC